MPALEDGQRFERYRVVRWLGSGVSGESYEAEDLRKVTLKLIHPRSTLSDSARRQFFREMQGIGTLNHPFLASVLDYGENDGRLYVARRYVSSGSLLGAEGRMWYRPPFVIADAIQYGHQLAQALQHIHNHGYLHGSLTLANVLVLRSPNVENEPDYAPFLLADVGLANFVRRFGQLQTPFLPITAAPEQLGKRVTPASDQFALAVLLYLWIAGRPPYLGSPQEIEHLKLTESFTPLTSLNQNVSIEQELVIHRALAVYPEERYPSVLAFANALLATLPKQKPTTPLPELITQPGTSPDVDLPPHAEPRPLSLTKSTPVSEPPTIPQTQPNIVLEFEPVPPTDPVLSVEPDPLPQPAPDVHQPLPNPATDPVHIPDPEPLPQQAPEPLPVPAPEPLPQPAPEPLPVPAPEPLPQPAPEPLPQPAPEPLPQPKQDTNPKMVALTAIPQTEPLTEDGILEASPRIEDIEPIISARLIIMGPNAEEPREVLLEREETRLGRAGDSDIYLDDSLASRHHALLRHEQHQYLLHDLRSANGVFVNGQKLTSNEGYVLFDGDHISIGNYELIFRFKLPNAAHETDYDSPQGIGSAQLV